MEESQLLLEKFTKNLKKYPTCEVAKFFSEIERKCYDSFNSPQGIIEHEYVTVIGKKRIPVFAWLLPEIIYYSTINNDFRSGEFTDAVGWNIYGLYHNYAYTHDSEYWDTIPNDDSRIFAHLVYGISQQQFIYQQPKRYLSRFSRSFYLLANLQIKGVSLETIIQEKLQISLDKYVNNLMIITLLSLKNVVLNRDILLESLNDIDSYKKILSYLSIDYYECRELKESLGKDVFKTKPILYTQNGQYIATSCCLMLYNLGDNLYWLFKNKFARGNAFVVKFGEVFENYVYEILWGKFGDSVERIPRVKGEKSADFLIRSNSFNYLVEVKSGVAKIDAKTITLNIKSIEDFVKNNITDALEQIDASAIKLNDKTIIPIVVNYDVLLMSEALLTNIESLYNPKNYNIKHTLLLEIDKLEDLITKCDSLDKLDDAILKNLRDDKDFTGIKIFNVLDDVIPNKDAFYDNKFASIDKRFFKEKSC